MPQFVRRVQRAWNAFLNRDPTNYDRNFLYAGSSVRQDRIRISTANIRSITNAVYNRIAVDCSSIDVMHVRVDEEGNFKEVIKSDLNYAITKEANIDQTGRELFKDIVMSMFDEGCIALIPIESDMDPEDGSGFKIYTIRVGKILEWFPYSVRIEAYNELTGLRENRIFSKDFVVIIENPFYSIMNEPNSLAKRLLRVLAQLDRTNENNSSGKLDLVIQLPYATRTEVKKNQARERANAIEQQLTESQHGLAFIDSTEKVIQLNRSIENDLWNQAKDLQEQLFNELGFPVSILNGTADSTIMMNYYSRTVEPILSTICENIERKWISKTARTQGQAIRYFRDPFKLIPVEQTAELSDKLTRNEIMTSNEIRSKIGLKPSDDPKANELRNANLNHPDEEEGEVQHTLELYHYGMPRRSGRYPWGSGERPYQANREKYGKELFEKAIKKNLETYGRDKSHNILYISGISGSGKSTLAEYLSDSNTEVLHLDSYFELNNIEVARKNRNKSFNDFLIKNGFNVLELEDKKKFEENVIDYFKNVDEFSRLSEKFGEEMYNNNKKVIMEGVQIGDETLHLDRSFYDGKPYIEMTTDKNTSEQRRKERDKDKDK